MEDTDLKWRKASYSSNGGGNCVEVGRHTSHVLVRDTKDRNGSVLRISPAVWQRFADRLKSGRSLAGCNPSAQGPLPLLKQPRVAFRVSDGHMSQRITTTMSLFSSFGFRASMGTGRASAVVQLSRAAAELVLGYQAAVSTRTS
jgi:hypothetical protein